MVNKTDVKAIKSAYMVILSCDFRIKKRGTARNAPRTIPLKMETKKGKETPNAIEASLPVYFYPVDFILTAICKTYSVSIRLTSFAR